MIILDEVNIICTRGTNKILRRRTPAHYYIILYVQRKKKHFLIVNIYFSRRWRVMFFFLLFIYIYSSVVGFNEHADLQSESAASVNGCRLKPLRPTTYIHIIIIEIIKRCLINIYIYILNVFRYCYSDCRKKNVGNTRHYSFV